MHSFFYPYLNKANYSSNDDTYFYDKKADAIKTNVVIHSYPYGPDCGHEEIIFNHSFLKALRKALKK